MMTKEIGLGKETLTFSYCIRDVYCIIESPFEIGYNGRYISLRKDSNNKHIDLHKVFDKQVVKDYVFEGRYKTSSLDTVSSAILGNFKIW